MISTERLTHRNSYRPSLHVLAYNLKRVMSLLGVGATIAAMRA
jgi:hypothetical protein